MKRRLVRVAALQHMGVRQRLWLGVGSLVVLLLVLACGALWQLRAMGQQLQAVVEVHGHRGELAHIRDLISYQQELADRLHPLDRVHTYASFYIADLAV